METQEITLVGGAKVTIPTIFNYSKCKGCGEEIIWSTTKNGKAMPIRWNTIRQAWVSHFSDCTDANYFRREVKNK